MKKQKRNLFIIILTLVLISTIYISAEELLTYRIKHGDTLSNIANKFKVKLEELININNIKNPDLIYAGQKIKIPASIREYTVKKGDSLSAIASAFSVDLNKIIDINNIKNPDLLRIGQTLKIPVSESRKTYQLASRRVVNSFIWPVQGHITSEYGMRIHPVSGRNEFHTGIDIAVPLGSPVYAAEDGVVVFSGWSKGYGHLVIIRHRNNCLTYYAHNLELLVEKGDIIKKGKVIALSGNSGISTGPHLHFEIRVNKRHTNPLNYLNKQYWQNGFRV